MRPSLYCVTSQAVLLAIALTCASIWLPGAAGAQQPSQEQQDAIRSSCRSDFLSLCSGVPRGGKEAFDCLKQNSARLSGTCRTAVTAVTPPAAPAPAAASAPPPPPPPPPAASTPVPAPAATAPARPAAPPAVTAPAPQPSRASAPVPPAPRPMAKPAAPAAATTVTPATPAAPPAPKLTQEEENALVRQSCVFDYRRFCRGVTIGEGRVIACLNSNAAQLTPACGAAIKVVAPR